MVCTSQTPCEVHREPGLGFLVHFSQILCISQTPCEVHSKPGLGFLVHFSQMVCTSQTPCEVHRKPGLGFLVHFSSQTPQWSTFLSKGVYFTNSICATCSTGLPYSQTWGRCHVVSFIGRHWIFTLAAVHLSNTEIFSLLLHNVTRC